MKKMLKLTVCTVFAATIAFTGCEAGLSQSESSNTSNEFSFSDMYESISTLKGEIAALSSSNSSLQGSINTLEASLQNEITRSTDAEAQLQTQITALSQLIAPVGAVIAWHKNATTGMTIPAGWVECSGGTVDDADSLLNGVNIPDLNGEARFLRGSSTSGTFQDDAIKTHKHSIYAIAVTTHENAFTINDGSGDNLAAADNLQPGTNGWHLKDYETYYTGDTETRPKNMSVVWIMRIK
ncbi:MAG: hypothetical protein GY754_02260 [bacterium]|nr:hypothetical protein [bacterium]